MVSCDLVTRAYTHIFFNILGFDSLVRRVGRIERPKGKAIKSRGAENPDSEEVDLVRGCGLWLLTLTFT